MENYPAQVPPNLAGALNSPDLSSKGIPRARAIRDERQLADIVKGQEWLNRDRNLKNGRIMAKYNAEKPFLSRELAEDGLLWKSNVSTQPLATLIDRIAPRFVRALNSARYLTSAKLPDHVPNAAGKSEIFQKEFTKLVRSREGAEDFWSEVAQENALFGYTCAANTDEYSWFPRHFRQDEFFVPAGTKQHASKASLVIVRETMLAHELFDMISDQKAAETAGWNILNTINAINKCAPDDTRAQLATSIRRFEDMYRESNLGLSLGQGAKVAILYNAFAVEVTGKVSHYIMDGRDWKLLFEREDQFDSMSEVTTFFSFQQANGNLMASKGVGRTVYALAGIIDRSRNEVMDRLQLSGKMVVQGDPKSIRAFKMSVIGNAIVISKEFSINAQKIDAGVEPFIALDKWVMNLMDEIGGNVSPASASGQMQGERVTNGQINYLADLQAESKDIKIARFLSNAATLLTQMQKRAANKHVADEDAKEFQAVCKRSMSEEEFQTISSQPASKTVDDYTELEAQRTIAVISEVIGDPMIDRKKALRRKLTAACDSDLADELLLPDEDPTVTAEQMRTQLLENMLLEKAINVPVSPRDADLIHLKYLMPLAETLAGQVATAPETVHTIQIVVNHANGHLQSAMQKSTPKDQLQLFVDQVKKIEAGIQKVANAAVDHLDSGVHPAQFDPTAPTPDVTTPGAVPGPVPPPAS